MKNSAEVLLVIDRGLRLRATESTSMNDTSSRSHTVFTIEVAMKCAETNDALAGKLHLVDLAGSERQKSDSSGIRMEEALHVISRLQHWARLWYRRPGAGGCMSHTETQS